MIGPRIPKLTPAEEKVAYAAATARDKGMCVRCGAGGDVERDHRQNRDSWNTVLTNLQLLGGAFGCGCHRWKTENPERAIAEGFAVPRWARPEWWPAYRFGVGWVIYLSETDSKGRPWTEITESTATRLMTSGQVSAR